MAALYEVTDAEPAARRDLLATIREDCQLKDGEPPHPSGHAPVANPVLRPTLGCRPKGPQGTRPGRREAQTRTQKGPDPASSKIGRVGSLPGRS